MDTTPDQSPDQSPGQGTDTSADVAADVAAGAGPLGIPRLTGGGYAEDPLAWDRMDEAREADYRQAYAKLRAQAVEVLTRAVTLPVPIRDTTAFGEPATVALDFADFLAGVLATVAANVGSIDRLTVGGAGSWEAALLKQLVSKTVGDRFEDLCSYRTAPVVVPLNYAHLAGDAVSGPHTDLLPDTTDHLTALWDALDRREAAIWAAYAAAHTAYTAAFIAAVHGAAAQIPSLNVPVTVDTGHDPAAPTAPGAPTGDHHQVTNPDLDDPATDNDALASHLWLAAFTAVPSPTIPEVPGTHHATTPTTSGSTTTSTSTSTSVDVTAGTGPPGHVCLTCGGYAEDQHDGHRYTYWYSDTATTLCGCGYAPCPTNPGPGGIGTASTSTPGRAG